MDKRLKRDTNRWSGADDTLKNYKEYISKRGANSLDIGYIDLLFVSNYKGGNSVIAGSTESVYKCLESHRKLLRLVKEQFPDKTIQSLTEVELDSLTTIMAKAFEACKADSSHIKGFSTAYCSTLYHLHFPELIPIIDRRVLVNRGFKNLKFDGTQVKDLHTHYRLLIKIIHKDLRDKKSHESLRDWDRDYFTQTLPKDYKKANLQP